MHHHSLKQQRLLAYYGTTLPDFPKVANPVYIPVSLGCKHGFVRVVIRVPAGFHDWLQEELHL